MELPKTIDQVIDQLNSIVNECKVNESRLGFFAVLYRKVTIRIKQGVINKEFDDNERMEMLDVIFANRYLEAYYTYKKGQVPTQSWAIAFKAAEKDNLLVLQHLLLGINAHINLDLGIAAALAVGDGKIQWLENDFNKINSILAEMVDDVQKKLNSVSPVFGLLDPLTGRLDEDLANFSIGKARDGAWKFATKYFVAKESNRPELLNDRDFIIALLAANLANPGSGWMKAVIGFIRLFATKKVSKIIGRLE